MKVFLLARKEFGYDEYNAKVIVAQNEHDARAIANEIVGDEGQIWDNLSVVICTEVDLEKPGEILGSFRNG